jgi:outer membrane protein assembly factor BamB
LNYFTNGLSGHRTPLTNNSIGLGFQNGTITAIDMRTGMIKWNYRIDFPPLVSGHPRIGFLRIYSIYRNGKIQSYWTSYKITSKRTGVVLALDNDTGKKMWTATVKGSIGVGGASVGGGMLFVPTGRVQSYKGVGGSIVAFGLP